ncbi:MAG: hypothetical protein IT324_18700 [Anaerolineae bacterium]|nr:hypothetical protein [Anaerolineae bacterium]
MKKFWYTLWYVQNVLRAFLLHDHSLAKARAHWQMYPRWIRSLQSSAMQDKRPWLSFQATDFMEQWLSPNSVVFEYGSGASTLYFAQRVGQIVSLEHHAGWYTHIQEILSRDHITNCVYALVEPTPAPELVDCAYSNPENYCSRKKEYRGFSFRDYVRKIEAYPDDHFDLVVVDGRARLSCVYAARAKVKPGGYLLLDDSSRARYHPAHQLLDGWAMTQCFGPVPYDTNFTETTFWRKPPAPHR